MVPTSLISAISEALSPFNDQRSAPHEEATKAASLRAFSFFLVIVFIFHSISVLLCFCFLAFAQEAHTGFPLFFLRSLVKAIAEPPWLPLGSFSCFVVTSFAVSVFSLVFVLSCSCFLAFAQDAHTGFPLSFFCSVALRSLVKAGKEDANFEAPRAQPNYFSYVGRGHWVGFIEKKRKGTWGLV